MRGHIKKVAMDKENSCIITDLILHSVNTTAGKCGWGRTFVWQDIHQVTKVVVVSNLWHRHRDDGSGCRGDRGRAGYWLLIGGFTGFLFIIRWQYNCDWNIGYYLIKCAHQVIRDLSRIWSWWAFGFKQYLTANLTLLTHRIYFFYFDKFIKCDRIFKILLF